MKKKAFRDWIAAHRPAAIGRETWEELRRLLSPVSERYLRELALASGIPVEQPWAGVRQHTLIELEQSLRELLQVYETALAAGDRDLARYCRKQVIAAKDRARFIARKAGTPDDKRARKGEMVEWMLVWLENPPVFPAWVEIRKTVRPDGT
jgi:hypothetical protein